MSVTHLKCSFEELNTVGIIISMVRTILTLSWLTDYVQVSGIHAKKVLWNSQIQLHLNGTVRHHKLKALAIFIIIWLNLNNYKATKQTKALKLCCLTLITELLEQFSRRWGIWIEAVGSSERQVPAKSLNFSRTLKETL